MNFISFTYLVFFAICFAAYWSLTNRAWQNRLMTLAGFVFYGWWDWRFCFLLLGTALVDYYAARKIYASEEISVRKRWVTLSMCSNLVVLGFFKYFNFFQESAFALLHNLGFEAQPWTLKILLPVGISFYTFQSMSYTIDVYRRQLRPASHLSDFLGFVTFFPQLVAGPIERATHLLPQFEAPRRFDLQMAKDGCRQILWGFAKKMILADNVAMLVDPVFAHPEESKGIGLALATVFFAFQIYWDFSAYSDIAIGTARLFGFELCANFRYPYFSRSPVEFWRRWHISLSTWFRDYVYIPLGGNRKGPQRHVINLMLTFFLSGLWHGANWTFIIWGIYHGLLVVLTGLVLGSKRVPTQDATLTTKALPLYHPAALWKSAGAVVSTLVTFGLICIGWIFFRAETLPEAIAVLSGIFTRPFSQGEFTELHVFADPRIGRPLMLGALLFTLVIEWFQRRKAHPLEIGNLPVYLRWPIYVALVWLSVYYYNAAAAEFIYFQF